MLVIAHRGNIGGADPDVENHPDQIDRCLSGHMFHIEVDIRRDNAGRWWLGHDKPQYEVDIQWLYMRSNFLWIHCKNINALTFLQNHPYTDKFNYFWHDTDEYALTSRGYIWAYPGKEINKPARAVAVLPELSGGMYLNNFRAVCTDYPEQYVKDGI